MRQYITPDQIQQLSLEELSTLRTWWLFGIEYDDDIVQVYISEEDHVYHGEWSEEHDFDYPEAYTGRLKNHQGTMLPLLSIGELIEFLDVRPLFSKRPHTFLRRGMDDNVVWIVQTPVKEYVEEELVDALWECVKEALKQ